MKGLGAWGGGGGGGQKSESDGVEREKKIVSVTAGIKADKLYCSFVETGKLLIVT